MNLYAELAEYAGKDETLVKECCKYAAFFIAKDWDPDDVIGNYRNSDLYIYDLTYYQTLLGEKFYSGYRRFLSCGGLKGLDFGGWYGTCKCDHNRVKNKRRSITGKACCCKNIGR